MMKNKLSILPFLTIILLIASFVSHSETGDELYTLSQLREQAVKGWQKNYIAYDRTIDVDISITLPDVETFPALYVSPVTQTKFVPVKEHNSNWGFIKDQIEVVSLPNSFSWYSPDLKLMNDLQNADPPPKDMSIYSDIISINDLKWDQAYAFRNPATVRDADALLHRVWAEYFPDEPLGFIPIRVEAYAGARPYNIDTGEYYGEIWDIFEGALFVEFDQTLRGIPFIDTIERSYKGGSALTSGRPYSSVSPHCEARIGGNYLRSKYTKEQESATFLVVKEKELLIDDLPLCGLDQVISTYETLIERGKLRRVDNLRLGYVGWYDKDQTDTLILLPVWVAEGVIVKDSKKEPGVEYPSIRDPEFGLIMVNAQTGELIDPWDDNPSRVYEVPEIIRWK